MFFIFSIFCLPFISSIVSVLISKKHVNKRYLIAIVFAFLTTIVTVYTAYLVYQGDMFTVKIGNIFGNSIVELKTSGRSMIFCSMIAILYPLALIYAIAYARVNNMQNQGIFFCFFHFSIVAGLIFGMSANLFTMFIFYEIITLSTYPLVVHNRDDEAKSSGRIYLFYLISCSSLFFLPALLIIQAVVGNTNFTYGGILDGHNLSTLNINILLLMMVLGIAKTAIFPVSYWLPSAMTAPTPVSSILHAVVVVKSGLFALISVIYFIFGSSFLKANLFSFYNVNWLTILSLMTILTMSIVAIFQDKIKKRLAYSTIAQLSYAILAASILSMTAMTVAFVLMVAHAFAKIILFFGAGIIYSYFHKNKLSQIYGIGKQIPITITSMCVACISLIGLPITIGFSAKYELLAMLIKYQNLFIIIIVVVSTLLSVSYCFPIVYNAIFAKNHHTEYIKYPVKIHDNIMFSFVMIVCTICVIGLFFVNKIIIDMIYIL